VNKRSRNYVEGSLINRLVQRIRLRSRISQNEDLETAEIGCANDIFLSRITIRLRAESTGDSMTLLAK